MTLPPKHLKKPKSKCAAFSKYWRSHGVLGMVEKSLSSAVDRSRLWVGFPGVRLLLNN